MRLETNGYYALGVPLYLGAACLEHVLAKRRGLPPYRFADTIGSLSGGLGEVVVGLFIGPLLLGLYDFGYAHLRLITWDDGTRHGTVIVWVLAFVLGDFCYYFYHRAGHRFGLLWAVHGVHHQSESFNLSLALRNPWFSDVYSFVFYAPLPILGVPPGAFFIAISLISLYAVSVHTHAFRRPGFFALVTPQTHVVHHAQNPRYRGRNLGAMFTVWDRLFGTHVEVDPSEPVVFGTSFGYETHDGLRSQFLYFSKLREAASGARTRLDAWKTLLMRPGWIPPGGERLAFRPPRAESAIEMPEKLYTATQFALTVAFAMWLLWFREGHPFAVQVVSAALIVAATGTIGGILDARAGSVRHEWLRILAALAAGVWLTTLKDHASAGLVVASASVASLLWLEVLVRARRFAPELVS